MTNIVFILIRKKKQFNLKELKQISNPDNGRGEQFYMNVVLQVHWVAPETKT